jgi:hypothetical protein
MLGILHLLISATATSLFLGTASPTIIVMIAIASYGMALFNPSFINLVHAINEHKPTFVSEKSLQYEVT